VQLKNKNLQRSFQQHHYFIETDLQQRSGKDYSWRQINPGGKILVHAKHEPLPDAWVYYFGPWPSKTTILHTGGVSLTTFLPRWRLWPVALTAVDGPLMIPGPRDISHQSY